MAVPIREAALWVVVGVLLALTVAALPSFGWFVAPVTIAAFLIVRRTTHGHGATKGIAIGAAIVIAFVAIASVTTA